MKVTPLPQLKNDIKKGYTPKKTTPEQLKSMIAKGVTPLPSQINDIKQGYTPKKTTPAMLKKMAAPYKKK